MTVLSSHCWFRAGKGERILLTSWVQTFNLKSKQMMRLRDSLTEFGQFESTALGFVQMDQGIDRACLRYTFE